MKRYNSIDYYGKVWDLPITAFDKLDGSNLRFEFSHKRGFYKFGSRTQLIDRSSDLGIGIDLFLNKYGDGLEQIFKGKEYRSLRNFVCYAELLGTKSEFGWHDFENDEFDITLIDVDRFQKGFVSPKQFIDDFGHLGIPRVVYQGELNQEFIDSIKRNDYDLSEGVICKGVTKTKKGKDSLYYCKVKTNDWFERLRNKNEESYNKEIKGWKKE